MIAQLEQERKYEVISHQTNTKAAVRILKSMTEAELRNLYSSLGLVPAIVETAPKDFVVSKIVEKASVNDLLQKREFVLRMIESHDRISSGLEKVLNNLDKETIIEICKELAKEELTKVEKKLEIVQRLVAEIPFDKIWKSRSLRKRTTSQKVSNAYLKRLSKEISSLNHDIRDIEKRHQESSLESLSELDNKIQNAIGELRHLSEQHESFLRLLSMKDVPTAFAYLEGFRKELVSLQDTLSPEKLCEFIEKVKSRLQIDDFSFTSKGLEIMLAYYLSKETKGMGWSADFQEFVSIVREEIPKIEIMPNQAEIPALREKVIKRLGISEAVFDRQLVQAWQKGYVSLHSGAPRERDEVKFLEYEGNKYFYVSLRWE